MLSLKCYIYVVRFFCVLFHHDILLLMINTDRYPLRGVSVGCFGGDISPSCCIYMSSVLHLYFQPRASIWRAVAGRTLRGKCFSAPSPYILRASPVSVLYHSGIKPPPPLRVPFPPFPARTCIYYNVSLFPLFLSSPSFPFPLTPLSFSVLILPPHFL